ncbi:I78 family peptidase inhibitor [Limimaricola sp.]|uniref:I78 family peptidase inhibitor n=1 Tax=Limimaricola sp. TaxID=2211665 RepID=UPI0025BACCF2|nr:I78 family peptidase inhibitor [Limimaricola sp.]
MRRFVLALLLLGAACAQVSAEDGPPALPQGADDTCDAAAHADLIGQDAGVLSALPASRMMRIIRPDTAVTMDYFAGRLNIDVDAGERIVRLHCG